MIRTATLNDVSALVALEDLCFDTDRLSRRSFRHLLSKGHALTLVDEDNGQLRGYIMLLFHAGTSLARLYSIAVAPPFRGQSIAKQLVKAAENAALAQDCVSMRLEVRQDNIATIRLYEELGYRKFGSVADYYEDHMDALRFEKGLAPHLRADMVPVPFFQQSLEFTCGPAALMMAMKALDGDMELERRHEIRIWRESTTVFMTSGHGGCGVYGLALAAYHRGFDVEIYVNEDGTMFIDSVRSEVKKEVIRLVEEDFVEEIKRLPLPIHYRPLSVGEIHAEFDSGAVPVVLISSYRIYKEKFPHWVVVTGFDDRFIYVHDPYVDTHKGKSVIDSMNMPILQKDFERMARYGKTGQRAALIIRKHKGKKAKQA
ncbi:GNAT family N-acetyltransferase/peptidase C39 family protein [Sulfuriflexus mobilis]|uniref:GNAT family N-acetyltransferase/peptidase C39 family protein n=1 Tax=Sulfuriflexus mobilis TaxID=1811807 RepID=UPI000F833A3A|nr:GNAT family N-acetyltransferase/peptidase C39 family protein [Sulfuriflexus mobilis]